MLILWSVFPRPWLLPFWSLLPCVPRHGRSFLVRRSFHLVTASSTQQRGISPNFVLSSLSRRLSSLAVGVVSMPQPRWSVHDFPLWHPQDLTYRLCSFLLALHFVVELDVVQASEPPPVEWFETPKNSRRSPPSKRWSLSWSLYLVRHCTAWRSHKPNRFVLLPVSIT